jgi:hypothetical protein
MHPSRIATGLSALCGALALAACGGGGTSEAAAVGGTVTGLAAGATVSLQENNAAALSVSGSTGFEFPATLAANTPYTVTVATQPAGATCSVVNGSGTVDANADAVTNVSVVCQAGNALSGTVTGLPANAVLTLSDGNSSLPVNANGSFAFTDLFTSGASYTVSVAAQPAGTQCTVANGSGAIDANGDPVSNIAVSCAPAVAAAGTVGGSVQGLAPGNTLTLVDGVGTVTVAFNGSFVFADTLPRVPPMQSPSSRRPWARPARWRTTPASSMPTTTAWPRSPCPASDGRRLTAWA